MLRDIQRGVVAIVVLTVVVCGAYPLVVWAIAQTAFHSQAQGSLITRNGRVVGSHMLAQGFTSARYFHPRPSATDYAANASAASNLGPNSADLAKVVEERLAAVVKEDGVTASQVPADLLTASASGVDPDVSKAAALIQVDRVAKARGLDPARVRALVESHVDSPTLGLLGTTRVNVLDLNLALDALK
jgi:K+-transporting ATPase ATPase C chain